MAEQGVLSAQKLYLDGFDLSGDMRSIALTVGVEGQDSTKYDTALAGTSQRTEDPGLNFAQLESTALWRSGTNLYDEIVNARLRTAGVLVTYCPLTGAEGERAYLLSVFEGTYKRGAKIGEMLMADLSARCSGKLLSGTVLFNGSRSSNVAGSAFQLGAVSATQSIYARLQMITGTGTGFISVQSDNASNFPSAATVTTFTIANAPDAQSAVVAGPLTDDWYRMAINVTGGGPFGFVLSMAIL